MPPSPDPVRLRALVRAVDADLAPRCGGAILHATGLRAAGGTLARFPLDGAHPLDLLVGLVAPPHWEALGVSCTGTARVAGRPPERVRVTILLDRRGGAAGAMRRDAAVGDLPGRPEGVVADACRRALGLPTAPPPATTAGLWTLLWLDRLVRAAGAAAPGDRPQAWSSVARLHPAAGAHGDLAAAVRDPDGLMAASAALAAAWPWRRLRTQPAAAPLPTTPSPALAAWVDDGMWARWLLADLPGPGDLLSAVRALLPPGLAAGVARVVAAAA